MGGSIMKLFEVTNGYVAETYVHVLVVCETLREAVFKAREVFKKEAENGKYPDEYWKELKAECLCDDISNGYVSEIRGG